MSDPIKDLGKAAEVYARVEAEPYPSREERAEAFNAAMDALKGALDTEALSEQQRATLAREWFEYKEALPDAPPGTQPMDYRARRQQRDLIDSAAYMAADPEDLATQGLRTAVPLPARDDFTATDARVYDTGRFQLETRYSQVDLYDKATGSELEILVDESGFGYVSRQSEKGLVYHESKTPSVVYLLDGTRIFLSHDVAEANLIIKDGLAVAFGSVADRDVREISQEEVDAVLERAESHVKMNPPSR